MELKDKRDIQLDSLIKLLNQIGIVVDKSQDEEFEAKGWQKGFMEFIRVLEQVSFKSGYKQGFREGVEKYQKDLMTEIEFQKKRYEFLAKQETMPVETRSDTHPDERVKIMNERKVEESTPPVLDSNENRVARKKRIKALTLKE